MKLPADPWFQQTLLWYEYASVFSFLKPLPEDWALQREARADRVHHAAARIILWDPVQFPNGSMAYAWAMKICRPRSGGRREVRLRKSSVNGSASPAASTASVGGSHDGQGKVNAHSS